jgi:hypothetical protein
LLSYWTEPNREKKLFFCQVEALETAIYIAEVVGKCGDGWIENSIRQVNDTSNPGLSRTAGWCSKRSKQITPSLHLLLLRPTPFHCLANPFTGRCRQMAFPAIGLVYAFEDVRRTRQWMIYIKIS